MIGARIREQRREVGLSLRDLGEITGLTASFISQVENDLTSPSISSLQRIATALRTPMFAFLENGGQTESVMRKDKRKTLSFPDSKLIYELLTSPLEHQMAGFLIRLESGARHETQELFRPTEEMMVVIQGEMEIKVGDHTYHLFPGDTIYYEGPQLQWFASVGEMELQIVCAMTPPAL